MKRHHRLWEHQQLVVLLCCRRDPPTAGLPPFRLHRLLLMQSAPAVPTILNVKAAFCSL